MADTRSLFSIKQMPESSGDGTVCELAAGDLGGEAAHRCGKRSAGIEAVAAGAEGAEAGKASDIADASGGETLHEAAALGNGQRAADHSMRRNRERLPSEAARREKFPHIVRRADAAGPSPRPGANGVTVLDEHSLRSLRSAALR